MGYSLPGGRAVYGVTYAEGRLVAAGESGAVWVSSPLVQVEAAMPVVSGELPVTIHGPPGMTYDVQVSEDLARWTSVRRVDSESETTRLTVTLGAGQRQLFLRVLAE